MSIKKIYPFVILLLITSCSKKTKTVTDFFPKAIQLKMVETSLNCDKIGTPCTMIIHDSVLTIIDYYYKHNLSLINLKTFKHFKHFCIKGNGPGEINNVTNLGSINDQGTFFMLDDMQQKLLQFSLNSVLNDDSYYAKPYRKIKQNLLLYTAAPINDSLIIATIGSFTNRYGLFNKEGELIKHFGAYPKSEKVDIQKKANPLTFQCDIVVKPDNKSFVTACSRSPIMEIYDVVGNDVKNVIKHQYHFPKINAKITETSRSITTLGNNIYGFLSVTVSAKYIYTLYSGRTYMEYRSNMYKGNHILVYDWDGNHIANLQLDTDLVTIAIDEKNNKIYGFAEEPEIKLYQTSIPESLRSKI